LVPTLSITGTGTWDRVAAIDTIGIGIAQAGPSGDSNDVLSMQNFDATQPNYTLNLTLGHLACTNLGGELATSAPAAGIQPN